MYYEELTNSIIGCAIEVHKTLGPGLLENIYSKCLSDELQSRGINFVTETSLPVSYKGRNLEMGYRLDFIIEDKLILELKTVEKILPIHRAQLLTYLKISKLKLGLLLNFNSTVMKDGIVRLIL